MDFRGVRRSTTGGPYGTASDSSAPRLTQNPEES
jgi:hypothetical protein